MDILRFAQTLYQKSVTLLKYHRKVAMTGSVDHVVLVQKESGEKVCWFYGDMGFSSGVYGDEAEAAFADRTRTSTITQTNPSLVPAGGFPVGKVACIAGPSSSGKSLLEVFSSAEQVTKDLVTTQPIAANTLVDAFDKKAMASQPRKVVFANINQGRREVTILEDIQGKYILGVYTMPAGRAFLCRVYPKNGATNYPTTPANKKERGRHAKAVLEAQLDAAYELLDAADEKRGRTCQLVHRAEARRLIERTELALKNIAANS